MHRSHYFRLSTALALLTANVVILTAAAPAAIAREQQRVRVIERTDLQSLFAAEKTSGTMVVRQEGRGRSRLVLVGTERSGRRFLPSSTFKIPNSLIAIDAGVASGAGHPYPGPNPNYVVDGQAFLPQACEGDLTLELAFANSCIPIYQQIARAIGRPAYRWAVRALRYGNRDVASAQVDDFWLRGRFAISAREQVRFLERLRRGTLPVSSYAMSEVRRMMLVEQTSRYALRAKTGYVFSTKPSRGWWVGWVHRRGRTSTFALNLDITQPSHAAARTEIGRRILARLGAF